MGSPAPGPTPNAPRSAGAWLAGWRGGVVLALVCVAAHWPGSFTLPPVDRDESRFAQASRQVLDAARAGEAEGMVAPRIGDRLRLNKPPLIYWLQAAAAAGGDDGSIGEASGRGPPTGGIGWFRIPSLVSAMLAALLTWRAGLVLRFAPGVAWLAGAMLAACIMVMWDARQARADQLLLATTTGAMLELARLWTRRGRPARETRWSALRLHVWLGLAVMAKGPVGPMIAALAIVGACAARRDSRLLRHARPLQATAVVVAMAAPWVIAVGQAVGWEMLWSILIDETLGRAATAKESHWGPPGYHLVLLAVVFFPGSLATARGFVGAWKRCYPRRERPGIGSALAAVAGRWRGRDREMFLLAWIVPSWIVFELMATKLPHYTMPLLPAIALLSAREVVALGARRSSVDRTGRMVWLLIGAALVVGAPLGVWWTDRYASDLAVVAILSLLAAVCLSGFWLWWGRWVRAQLLAMAAAAGALAILTGGLLPGHGGLWVSSRVAAILDGADPAGDRPIALVRYHEDSLVFLTNGRAERMGSDRIGAWLAEHPRGLVVAPAPWEGDLAGLTVIGGVEGLNYSNGRQVRLVVVGRE